MVDNDMYYDPGQTVNYEDPIYSIKPIEWIFDTTKPWWFFIGTHNYIAWWPISNILYTPFTQPDTVNDPMYVDLALVQSAPILPLGVPIPFLEPYLEELFGIAPPADDAPVDEPTDEPTPDGDNSN